MQQLGKILILTGLLLIVAGAVLWLLPGRMGWFGHLPGDIRIRRENFAFYFPLTSMLLVSAGISILLWLIGKIFR
jgi:hypothetical protein